MRLLPFSPNSPRALKEGEIGEKQSPNSLPHFRLSPRELGRESGRNRESPLELPNRIRTGQSHPTVPCPDPYRNSKAEKGGV